MTTTGRPDVASGIDYSADRQRHRPELVRRRPEPPPARRAARATRTTAPSPRSSSRNMGGVIGGRVAARAEITDKNPPRLEKYDALGQRGQRGRPPPERARHEARPLGERLPRPPLDRRGAQDARRPPAARRQHRLPLLPQPGRHRHGVRHRHDQQRRRHHQPPRAAGDPRSLPPPPDGDGLRRGVGRRHVHDRDPRRQRPRAAASARARKTRRRLAHQRLEVVLLEPRRRSDPHARASRRRPTRASPASRTFLVPKCRADGTPQRHPHPPPQGQARHEGRPDRRGRLRRRRGVPHGPRDRRRRRVDDDRGARATAAASTA